MRSRLASLAVMLLLPLVLPDSVAADLLREVVVGPQPLPRPLNLEEHETFTRLRNFGVIKKLPETIQDPAKAEIIELPPASVGVVVGSFGGSLEKLPSPSGMSSTVSPVYPAKLKERRDVASARCQFEVLPDGSVGRIFATNFSHEEFLQECARALKQWKFTSSPATRHFQILFEARP